MLVGAAGQLGQAFAHQAAKEGLRIEALDHATLDVTDGAAVTRAAQKLRPDWIVNCAAFHNIDGCEKDPMRAELVNVQGPRNLASAARLTAARLLHVSTDYVFDGTRTPPMDGVADRKHSYLPNDATAPVNHYGRSKAAGEAATRATLPDTLIVRVASLFGDGGARQKGGNFIDKIVTRARSGEPVTVVDDQWMSPTWTTHAAQGMLNLMTHEATGTCHVTSGGACTWWELADEALRIRGLPPPQRSKVIPGGTPRPRNSSLVAPGFPGGWRQAVGSYLKDPHD